MANGEFSWGKWLGEKAGGGLVSAPVSFFVTLGLREAFPGLSAEAKMQASLDRIEKAVGRIEEKLDKGLEQINTNFEELKKHLDIQHLETRIENLQQSSADPIEDIKLYFKKLQQQKDLPKIAAQRDTLEKDINTLTDVLRGQSDGSYSPFQDGLLKLWVEMFAEEFTQPEKSRSSDLLSSYLLLENRFDHLLHWQLQGVVLVEYGYCKDEQINEMQKYHDDFVKDELKPLLDNYLWWTEELVLNYFTNLPYKPDDPNDEELQRLMGILLYIFKRCDLFVFGVLSTFSHGEPPRNLLCGRVIGPKWVLACVEKRVSELMKLTEPVTEKIMQLFAPMETVSRQHSVSLVDFNAPNLMGHTPPILVPPEQSTIQVLRYRLTGFPEEIVDSQDSGKKPEVGSAESKMRGIPGIERIGYPSIWDKRFSQIAHDILCDESLSIGGVRCRAETLFALMIPPAFETLKPGLCTPVDTPAPYIYSIKYMRNWHSQLPNKSRPTSADSCDDVTAPGYNKSVFWHDGSSIDTEREIKFYLQTEAKNWLGIWEAKDFDPGNAHDVWFAPLFQYDKTMPPAKINIGLWVAWSVQLYGADLDYLFKIDLITKDSPLDLAGLKQINVFDEFLPPKQAHHLPGRSYNAWGSFHTEETNFISKTLPIQPGEYVWLRAEAILRWPGNKPDPFAIKAHKKMDGNLKFNVQDIMFSWA